MRGEPGFSSGGSAWAWRQGRRARAAKNAPAKKAPAPVRVRPLFFSSEPRSAVSKARPQKCASQSH
eukprot:7394681-Lingulodinium_polyedra.AAC.1